MRKFTCLIASTLAGLFLLAATAQAMGMYQSGTVGNDVSYPNCSAKPPRGAAFGIIGVTGGLNFQPNSCLTKQGGWFGNKSLYVNTGYPGKDYGLKYQNSPNACAETDLNCLAYNYGYNAGVYAINYATSQGVTSTTWWLDVETMNSWTGDYQQNRSSLQGEMDALQKYGVTTLGAYSTTAQWGTITNAWQNQLPNWGATTWQTAKQAAKYCTGHDFTGGGTWLLQFKGSIDQDYAC